MKIKFIINPKSNKVSPDFLKRILRNKFARHRVDIEETIYPQHATAIARNAVKDDYDTVVAVGGDGTVNEVLNGIAGTDVALGIIPAGAANDLASLYQIPTVLAQACDVILQQCFHCIDVICVNGCHYLTGGGLGLPSEVAGMANRIKGYGIIGKLLRHILRNRVYILALLWALIGKARRKNFLKIKWNGFWLFTDSLSLTVNNQPFLGHNFIMSPGAVNDDGRFDICLIRNPKTRLQIISILTRVLTGKHISLSSVKTWCSQEVVIETKKTMEFFGDGEIIHKNTQFRIIILPSAIRLLIPGKKARL